MEKVSLFENKKEVKERQLGILKAVGEEKIVRLTLEGAIIVDLISDSPSSYIFWENYFPIWGCG